MKYKDAESLKKNRDFQLVYKTGTSYVNKYLVMYARENQLGKNRIGISVSKKVGNSVQRSRITRLVKENFRLLEEGVKTGYDIVITVRSLPRAAKTPNNKMKAVRLPSYEEIRNEMYKLFLKLDFFQERDK